MTIYNWSRQWVERGTRQTDDDDLEFDPLFTLRQPKGHPSFALADLANIPILILLGEPGIGKTDEIKKHYQDFQSPQSDDAKLFYPEQVEDFRGIFTHPIFEVWSHGNHNLYLFIDGLDEEPLGFEEINRIIRYKFTWSHGNSINRLYIRMACRTAAWPESLGETLATIWGVENVGIYEIAPLERDEILLAANVEGLNDESFLEEVERAGVVALASKPLTLKSLIKTYAQTNGRLSDSQTELYERYCKALCEEPNPTRQEVPRLRGNLSSEQRMNVASQIAAIMLLTKHNSIWRSTTLEGLPESSIAIDELYSGQTDINREKIEEVLSTGLFVSRGERRLGWAHQSFAEFLAARYLGNLPKAQIRNLLFHPEDGKIKPELIEVAAWLASNNDDALQLILEAEEVIALFKTSIVVSDPTKRAKIMGNLLESLDKGALLDMAYSWKGRQRRYHRLNHPDLVHQLHPYIADNSRKPLARQVAIDVAEVCQLQELQNLLLEVALNEDEQYYIRKEAAFALNRIATSEIRIQLKPLIHGVPGDRDDDLKAAGLFAVWPDYITSEELFRALTPRRIHNYYGMYSSFIHRLSRDIDIVATDLPGAVKWVKRYTESYVDDSRDLDSSIQDLMNEIMIQAWNRLDEADVLEAFAEAAFVRLSRHLPILGRDFDFRREEQTELQQFRQDLLDNHEKRRGVLSAMFPLLLNEPPYLFWLGSYETPFILGNDLEWAITQYRNADAEDMRQLLLELIQRVFYRWDMHHMDSIYEAMTQDQTLKEKFHVFYSTELASESAAKARKNYELMSEREESRAVREIQTPIFDPPPSTRVLEYLERCEREDIKFWWHVNLWLMREANGNSLWDFMPDLTTFPGWQQVDETTRTRIIVTGLQYLYEGEPEPENWFGIGIPWRPALAGYRMLYFLLSLPEFLESLDSAIWKKWASIIVAYPSHWSNQEREPHRKLVAIAYRKAHDDVLVYLMELLGAYDEEGREVIFTSELLHKFDECWDSDLSEAVYEKFTSQELLPHTYDDLLLQLLKHNHSKAIEHALKLVIPIPSEGEERERAIKIAVHLLTLPQNIEWWPAFWVEFQKDIAFGREVITNIAGHYPDWIAIGAHLPESDLVDLYIWVATQFPRNNDYEELIEWSPVREVRDALLNHLISRGTQETVLGLRRVLDVFPDLYQAQAGLEKVQKYLRSMWQPPTPRQILELVQHQNARIVESSEQLLMVVIESLERLQVEFQAETPMSFALWNDIKKHGICRPKDEEDFSNYVKRHLEVDLASHGLIVNREVEIRRKYGRGGSPGEVPDIYIAATKSYGTQADIDPLVVVIEAKGSWYEHVKTSMQTQLVERYLIDNRYSHGLYLVGWFNCEQWRQDTNDPRHGYSVTLQDTIDTLRAELDAQAIELSSRGLTVKAFVVDVSLR
jgi:hypothetical protein